MWEVGEERNARRGTSGRCRNVHVSLVQRKDEGGGGTKNELVELGRETMENSSGDRTSMISGGIGLDEIARSRS